MEPIDEIILTTNPMDQYDLDFIEESDSGDDGKWVKHIFRMHNERSSAAVVSDPVSPPLPATRQSLRQYSDVAMLSKVDEYLLRLESPLDVDEYDCDDENEDSDDDGIVNCTIDGVQQPRYFCNSSPGLSTSNPISIASNNNGHSIATSSFSHAASEDTHIATGPDGTEPINENPGGVGFGEQMPNNHDDHSTDSEDSDSEYLEQESALKAFANFPNSLKTVKPLITDEELEYGAMEIVQNPWEYLDEHVLGDLLPVVKARLYNSMRE